MARVGKDGYEIEHVWANKPERYLEEFSHQADFQEYRHRIGGLLLLPKSFKASYGDLPYDQKLPHYNSQNLLARSLHPASYEHNPGFHRYVENTEAPFRPHEVFKRADLDQRQALYREIAEEICNPARLEREANT
jgi:hypothetical protein